MGMPAARVGDMHVCPMQTPAVVPIPHVGGPILPPCAITVLVGSLPQARITDMCVCVGPPDVIVKASLGVYVCGLPAARIGDLTAHGGSIVAGLPTVLIGDIGVVAPSPPGLGALNAVANAVNPSGSIENCGNVLDAVVARLNGTDPDATSPADQDGSFDEIEERFNTDITWGSNFQDAFNAVRDGGDGTMAVVGIDYSGDGSHVVILANQGGTVGIVEAQNWGEGQPAGAITDIDAANQRYNPDGGSNIGYGIIPPP